MFVERDSWALAVKAVPRDISVIPNVNAAAAIGMVRYFPRRMSQQRVMKMANVHAKPSSQGKNVINVFRPRSVCLKVTRKGVRAASALADRRSVHRVNSHGVRFEHPLREI